MQWKGNRPKRKMRGTTDVVNRATLILIVIIDLTTTTTIPSIHTMAAIIPFIPTTDIPTIHTIHITDTPLIMGIVLIDIATQSRAPGLVI